MEIKPCPFCGEQVFCSEGYKKPFTYFVRCLTCGIQTDRQDKKEDAIDVWNARHETNPSEADRWFKEATEQRARADLLQMQVDELSEALNQARRMLAYAGKLQ